MTQTRPLILGLGNPILRDDRAGLEIVRALHARLPEGAADVCEASVGGIELLHLLDGHDRVLIVDSLEPGHLTPGEVREIPLGQLAQQYTPISPHNAGLLHCLELGRVCGMHMPNEVHVFAIGVCDPYTFSESCTDVVQAALPGIVDHIYEQVFCPHGYWPI